uniref:Uncharacterized protein n=1 Tax=Phaeomonas parva TaxID=124430 RepID=A0A7S1XZL4_9STRA
MAVLSGVSAPDTLSFARLGTLHPRSPRPRPSPKPVPSLDPHSLPPLPSWRLRSISDAGGEHELDLHHIDGGGYSNGSGIVRPARIILVRHGESAGNVDPQAYVNTPDWKIPLTKKGWKDARLAGQQIKEIVGDSPIYIYTSPYLRTKQTLAGMVGAWDTNEIVGVREEPRLTEQQFGNFQNVTNVKESREQRTRFGRFYFRFPEGESGLDVYNRVTSFIATLFRDFSNKDIAREDLDVIIVTHGLTLRLFLMRFFHYTIHDFENSYNPNNGAFVVMQRQEGPEGQSWYELMPEGREALNLPPQNGVGSLWKILQEMNDAASPRKPRKGEGGADGADPLDPLDPFGTSACGDPEDDSEEFLTKEEALSTGREACVPDQDLLYPPWADDGRGEDGAGPKEGAGS